MDSHFFKNKEVVKIEGEREKRKSIIRHEWRSR